ncbi:MAG: hypothetical protein AMJ81_02045 [Phycisphaerae bacterium SM23_33]|nr:MAG: hypothetical protein AMJ81_02045 [Phycisphaerae bacterium SM23_33]
MLLEQAIHKEQAAGDLDAAMKIYQQIIEESKANRRHVAEALYRLGMCHLKKRDEVQAVAQFRELVRSFPEQRTFVAKAEAELAKLTRPPEYLPLNQAVERTVNDDGMNRDWLIDLDAGKLFTPPKGLGGGKDQALAWMAAQGIDGGAETNAAGPGLWGVDMVVIPLAGPKWESLDLTGIRDDLSEGKPGTPAVMSALGELPRSYAFKTREGSIGVLQILQLVNEPPRHIKIRYKLLQHGTSAAAPTQPFPEFVGCRIEERVALKVVPKGKEGQPAAGGEVHEYSHLEIAWQVDPEIAKQARNFAVAVRERKADGKSLWSVADLPADASSVVYGQAKGGRTIRAAEELPPGEYVIDVHAYDAPQQKLDPAKALGTASANLTVKPLIYTQISINEVQPGGTIRFRLIEQHINTSSAPVSQRHFINSDYVEVERMSDDRSRPVKFTATHEGNIYRYQVTLNEPVAPGKAVLLASEGTVGLVKRSDRVFRFSQQHWPGSARTRRLEIYRLPKGAELLDTTPADMARRQRDGRWELFVEKIVPAGGSITTGFGYRLGEGEVSATEPLKLAPVPWKDGEQMHLKLKSMVGMEIGALIYTAKAVKSGDVDAWRVESWLVVPVGEMSQFTRVDARRDSFAPISSRTFNSNLGDYRAEYTAGKVKLTVAAPGKSAVTRVVSLEEVAYDNEQALFLIRRLPLKEGYRGSFPIFPVMGGTPLECRIRVVSKEKLAVPAGRFDCHKVILAVYSGETKGLEHTLWFSADENKYLVKYDSGSAVMELAEVLVRKPAEPELLADAKSGVRLALPAGWHSYLEPQEEFRLHLLPPEPETSALLAGRPREAEVPSARKYAEQAATKVQGFFEGYKVRPGSWAELETAGLPTARYVADYQDTAGDKVEYRTYVLGRSKVYWFVFRIRKDQFEAARKEFDAIVESLKIVPVQKDADRDTKPTERAAL